MSISVTCAICDRTVKVKDELAGRRVKCPGCLGVIQVPQKSKGPAQPEQLVFDETEDFEPPVRKHSPSSRRGKPSGGKKQAQNRPLWSRLLRTTVLTILLATLTIVLGLNGWGRLGRTLGRAPSNPNSVAGEDSLPKVELSDDDLSVELFPTLNAELRVPGHHVHAESMDLSAEDFGHVPTRLWRTSFGQFRTSSGVANSSTVRPELAFQEFDQLDRNFLKTVPGSAIRSHDNRALRNNPSRLTTFTIGTRIVGWQQVVLYEGRKLVVRMQVQDGKGDFSGVQQKIVNTIQVPSADPSAQLSSEERMAQLQKQLDQLSQPEKKLDPLSAPWTECVDALKIASVQGPGTPGRVYKTGVRNIEKFIWQWEVEGGLEFLTFSVMPWNQDEIPPAGELQSFAEKHSAEFEVAYKNLVKPAVFQRRPDAWNGRPSFETRTTTDKGLELREYVVYSGNAQVKIEHLWPAGRDEPMTTWNRFFQSLKLLP